MEKIKKWLIYRYGDPVDNRYYTEQEVINKCNKEISVLLFGNECKINDINIAIYELQQMGYELYRREYEEEKGRN